MPEIILVDPPISLEKSYGSLKRIGSTLPSLGILTLAACLREEDLSVGVMHSVPENLDADSVAGRVIESGARFAGFRTIASTIDIVADICRKIKTNRPNIVTIAGGPHITAVPEETFARFPEIDIGVVGEGEIALIRLLDALRADRDLSSVEGLIYRNGSKGIETTGKSPRVKNLDTLPFPAFDLLPGFPELYHPSVLMYKRLPSLSMVSSRGCTGKCIFCDRNIFGNRLRSHSAGYVFKLMSHLQDSYGVRDFVFYDDNFILYRSFIKELCGLILENGRDFSWSGMARVDFVDQELLHLMKKAGCWQIAYGIESGSPEILKILNKGHDPGIYERALAWTGRAGINTKGYFIMGNPGETLETIRETVEFALRVKLDDFEMSLCSPLPNTELADRVEEFGTRIGDWEQMTNLQPVFIPDGLDKKTLDREYRRAVRKFYLRPGVAWTYLKRLISDRSMASRIWFLARAFFLSPAR